MSDSPCIYALDSLPYLAFLYPPFDNKSRTKLVCLNMLDKEFIVSFTFAFMHDFSF